MKFSRNQTIIVILLAGLLCGFVLVGGWIVGRTSGSSFLQMLSQARPTGLIVPTLAMTTPPPIPASSTPTFVVPGITLPPTWTPLPTDYLPAGSAGSTQTLVVGMSEPTNAQNQSILSIPTFEGQRILFSGAGNTTTQTFPLPPGEITISWNTWRGHALDQYLLTTEANHKEILEQLQKSYKAAKAVYDELMETATNNSDADQMLWIQTQLNMIKSQYNEQVKRENTRYTEERKRNAITLKLQMSQPFTTTLATLVSDVPMGTGTTVYTSQGGTSYYLLVTTNGDWTIQIGP